MVTFACCFPSDSACQARGKPVTAHSSSINLSSRLAGMVPALNMSAWAMLTVVQLVNPVRRKVLQKSIIFHTHFHVDLAQTSLLHWFVSACGGKHNVAGVIVLSQKGTQGAVLSHSTSSYDCWDLMETQTSSEFATCGKLEGIQDTSRLIRTSSALWVASLSFLNPRSSRLHLCDFADAYWGLCPLAILTVLQAW